MTPCCKTRLGLCVECNARTTAIIMQRFTIFSNRIHAGENVRWRDTRWRDRRQLVAKKKKRRLTQKKISKHVSAHVRSEENEIVKSTFNNETFAALLGNDLLSSLEESNDETTARRAAEGGASRGDLRAKCCLSLRITRQRSAASARAATPSSAPLACAQPCRRPSP